LDILETHWPRVVWRGPGNANQFVKREPVKAPGNANLQIGGLIEARNAIWENGVPMFSKSVLAFGFHIHSSPRTWIDGAAAFEVEAAASGEAAAFGFVGGWNVEVKILRAAGESWIDGIEVARVEGWCRNFGG
jgi:hypothetical protein